MEIKSKQYEPEHWVDQYGDALYTYALLRLRNVTDAENVVQETFTAALISYKKSLKGLKSR